MHCGMRGSRHLPGGRNCHSPVSPAGTYATRGTPDSPTATLDSLVNDSARHTVYMGNSHQRRGGEGTMIEFYLAAALVLLIVGGALGVLAVVCLGHRRHP